MSWKTDLAKSVSKIDKATGITQNSLGILIDDFQNNKEHVLAEIGKCPESSHIEMQNGKMDKLDEKLDIMWCKLYKILIGAVVLICTVVGAAAAWKEIFK